MATRHGGRDTARIFEIHLFYDKEQKDDYLSLIQHLDPTLKLVKAFPLLDLEVSDQIIKINGNDVRQSSP